MLIPFNNLSICYHFRPNLCDILLNLKKLVRPIEALNENLHLPLTLGEFNGGQRDHHHNYVIGCSHVWYQI